MENTFYKISLKLTEKGFEWLETKWSVKETKTVFVLSKTDADGITIKRHLPKTDLLIPKKFLCGVSIIEYTIVCQEQDVQKAKQILMDKVTTALKLNKEGIDKLLSHVN